MKYTTILLAVTALFLLASIALAQLDGGSGPPTWYTVEEGTASGGGYHLASLAWRVEGSPSGGGYRLRGPAAPALRGNGCCCTWLPCVLRTF